MENIQEERKSKTAELFEKLFEKIGNEIGDPTHSRINKSIVNYLNENYESLRKNIQGVTSGVSGKRKKLLYSYISEVFGFDVDDFLSGRLQEKMRKIPVIDLELACLNKFRKNPINARVGHYDNPIREKDYSSMELYYIIEGLDARINKLKNERERLLKRYSNIVKNQRK